MVLEVSDEVGVELARVVPFCKVNAIMHHGGPVIAHSFDAVIEFRPGLMWATHP